MSGAVFDASGILVTIRRMGDEAPRVLMNASTIPLAFYEVGNAIWKESRIHRRFDLPEAKRLMDNISALLRGMGEIKPPEEEVLELAYEHRITFYDASYLAAARAFERTLVTDDRKIIKVGRKAGDKVTTVHDHLEEAGFLGNGR